jgi:hypothetical protein
MCEQFAQDIFGLLFYLWQDIIRLLLQAIDRVSRPWIMDVLLSLDVSPCGSYMLNVVRRCSLILWANLAQQLRELTNETFSNGIG